MGLSPIFPFRDYSSIFKVNSRERDVIFEENDNLESEDDIIDHDNTWNSDDFEENETYIFSYMLFTPTLEDLKNVLYVALNPYFEEFEIAVVSCPCLTRAPYNLAAAGLSDNTGILHMGAFSNFCPSPLIDFTYRIQDVLSRCSYDVFVIGSGFAAKPFMPYNGHLTMNAIVSTNHRNIINNSCIAYQHTSIGQRRESQRRLEIINDHNQIKCCIFGHFFFSEGKRGSVIKIRAKGRRSRSNIIALIQAVLTNRCQTQSLIGLGIVLVINGGRTEQRLLTDNFVSCRYNKDQDYCNQLKRHVLNCENLIALGALTSKRLSFKYNNKKFFLQDNYSMFNVLPNSKSLGNFFNDLTPEETEYTVYINVAQEKCFVI